MSALTRRAAFAVAALPVAGALPAAASATLAHPDAALLRACAAHHVALDAYNASSGNLKPELDPLWQAYARTLDVIGDTKPQTIEGMIAKARAARLESLDLAGDEAPEGTVAALWAWDLVRDLLALAPGAAA